MLIAIQVRELISSNVSHVLNKSADPAKALGRLKREIEEALVDLGGQLEQAERCKTRLHAEQDRMVARAEEWHAKARTAMDYGREDLAKQALLAREDCAAAEGQCKRDIQSCQDDMDQLREAIEKLEAKHCDVALQHADHTAGANDKSCAQSRSGRANPAERRMDRIANLEKRAEFLVRDEPAGATEASVERQIEELRRERAVDAELDALRDQKPEKAKKKTAKPRRNTKAA